MTQIYRQMVGSLGSSVSNAEFLDLNITLHIAYNVELDRENCVGIYTIGGDRVGQLISDDYRDLLLWLEEKIPLEIEKNRKAIKDAISIQ